MTERLNRRDFLKLLALSSAAPVVGFDNTYRPQLEKQPLVTLARESGRFEPVRIYPILHNNPQLPAEYVLSVGKVSCVTEQDLLSHFGEIVVTCDTNLFVSPDLTNTSAYAVSHQVNLDPNLYGGEIHKGVDMVSCDAHKNNTVFLNPIRARFLGRLDIGRLSPGVPIMQVVTSDNKDLRINLGGVFCEVFVLYGHLQELHSPFTECGDITEVGTPLGDITKDTKVGASSGPHVHVEMIAIPTSRDCTLQEALLHEEYTPRIENIYFDTNFIWKFLPGDIKYKTGIRPDVWTITQSMDYKNKYLGKK